MDIRKRAVCIFYMQQLNLRIIERRINMKINKEMTVGEIIRSYPEAAEVLMDFGMGCIGCPASQAESLEDAALVHGFKVDEILNALNEKIK